MTVGEQKRIWRRWAMRLSLPATPSENEQLVAALHRFLTGVPGRVLTYRPMPGEIDLDPLVEQLGAERFLTTRTPTSGPLTVHEFTEPVERHRFGYLQPVSDAPAVAPEAIDVALVPGVLFGRDGTRLGHGKGYYDRLLTSCRADIHIVAITVGSRIVSSVPTDVHDVSMTHLATDGGMLRPR